MGQSKIKKNYKNILVIGSAGGLAKITAGLLAKEYPGSNIYGVDSRESNIHLIQKNISYHQMRYTRGNFEKLFREIPFDIVYHLGRLSHSESGVRNQIAERLDLNVMGTGRILELALKHKVKKVIILSTYHVYGALYDNPVFISEEAHLRASIKYPELRDVTEMDQLCTNWMWKNQRKIETIILRPCNIIGPQINNTFTQYLQSKFAPVGIDFNPMMQFIHEFDMANVLVYSLYNIPAGIYNVSPDESISLREAKSIVVEDALITFPIVLLETIAKIIKKMWSFPDYLVDYIKYSCIIDNQQLMKHLPKDFFRFSTIETLELLKNDD